MEVLYRPGKPSKNGVLKFILRGSSLSLLISLGCFLFLLLLSYLVSLAGRCITTRGNACIGDVLTAPIGISILIFLLGLWKVLGGLLNMYFACKNGVIIVTPEKKKEDNQTPLK